MRARCASTRSTTRLITTIRSPATARRSRTYLCMRRRERSLRPHRHQGRAAHHRPRVVAAGHDREAADLAGLAAFPGGAEAVLVELPGAFALAAAGLVDRLARNLA